MNVRARLRDDLARIHQHVQVADRSPLSEFEQMVVVLEDRRYFSHPGVDVRSVVRELSRALTFQKHGGASTIEMQFVRTVTGYWRKTLRRKLYECVLAILVSARYRKIDILRSYLACAFFGSRLIGAEAAARALFGKDSGQLGAEEGAFVAAMLARPRPLAAPPAWEAKVRRRAEYGLQLRAQWSEPRHLTLALPPAPPARPVPGLIPPAESPEHALRVVDGKLIGPDGTAVAKVVGPGFMTLGSTPVAEWLAATPPSAAAASAIRVVRAVSMNEGRFEAINTYDPSFLSFGIFQWSVGAGRYAGELAGLLDLIQRADPARFDEYFGRHGLGVALEPTKPEDPVIGYLTVSGSVLRTPEDKQQLRDMHWAYRFWRAGHDPVVRNCQLALAISRIRLLCQRQVDRRPLADCLTSEYGVALLLDEHVNRPSNVPVTMGRALAGLPPHVASLDASKWSEHHEHALISLYLDARTTSSMTSPADRASRILACVRDGDLSDRRGSFLLPSADLP